jgi:two-component system sensor histidine kinase UhpB
VQVTLAYNTRELILTFADDGCGFDTGLSEFQNGHHFGLKGMRERTVRWGGTFYLTSVIGKGVRIEVHLPHNRRQGLNKPYPGGRKPDAVRADRRGQS